jgi:DNA-binding LytR/AlgR family response regulator
MIQESLLISNEQETRIIRFDTILYVITEDYLSTLILINHPRFICSKPLCKIMNHLPPYFFQISRACVVNMNEIISVKRSARKIVLSNSSELIVSMRKMKTLYEALTNKNAAFIVRTIGSSIVISHYYNPILFLCLH